MTRIKQQKVMPVSLVVRDRTELKQHPNEALSFTLDEASKGLPTVVVTIEDDREQSVEIAFDPWQIDALVEELKELQAAIQWQMAQQYWLFVRYGHKGKWHLRLRQWLDGHLCIARPRYQTTEIEVVEAGTTLWNGSVCRQCVQLWTEQIQSGWIRYQRAATPSLLPLTSVTTGKDEQ